MNRRDIMKKHIKYALLLTLSTLSCSFFSANWKNWFKIRDLFSAGQINHTDNQYWAMCEMQFVLPFLILVTGVITLELISEKNKTPACIVLFVYSVSVFISTFNPLATYLSNFWMGPYL